MSVARFIADQRTLHRVPHAVCCAILGLSRVLVLQVGQGTGHCSRSAPALSLDAKVREAVRRLRAHLRLAAYPPRSARGGLVGEREHRR